jgi:hypothetical protein
MGHEVRMGTAYKGKRKADVFEQRGQGHGKLRTESRINDTHFCILPKHSTMILGIAKTINE